MTSKCLRISFKGSYINFKRERHRINEGKKIQKFLPCNANSSIGNEKTRQGTIKLSFLTMFISVESFSLNRNQIIGLHYDDILQVRVFAVCSHANKYSYRIKQLEEKPRLSAHSIWGFRTHSQCLWLSLSLAMQDSLLPEPWAGISYSQPHTCTSYTFLADVSLL